MVEEKHWDRVLGGGETTNLTKEDDKAEIEAGFRLARDLFTNL